MCLSANTTSKCPFFPRFPSGSPKIGTLVVLKLWTFISFSNQVFLKWKTNILYPLKISFQQCITPSNWTSFHPYFQGICGRESNFQFDSHLFFLSQLIQISLNEQCEGTLSIYVSRPFYWCPRGPIWCFFAFQTKVLNIFNSRTSATPIVEVHLGVIWFHPLHSPPFARMCFTPKHIFSFMGPCISHLITNPILRLWHIHSLGFCEFIIICPLFVFSFCL